MGRGRSPAIAALAPVFVVATAAAASCALPLYQVGDGRTSSSGHGGAGATGPGQGGAGGAGAHQGGATSSSPASVTVSSTSGVGTGGAAQCDPVTKPPLKQYVTGRTDPRSIVATTNRLFWIEDSGSVVMMPKDQSAQPMDLGFTDACALASGVDQASGKDEVVVHTRAGAIDYLLMPSLTPVTLKAPSGPAYADERACAISVGHDAKHVYSFDPSGGTFVVAHRQTDGSPMQTYAQVAAPAAIDARDRDRIAWIDLGAQNAFTQLKTGGMPVGMTTPLALTGLCALGLTGSRWLVTEAQEPFIEDWQPSYGEGSAMIFRNARPGFFPGAIDCTAQQQFWVETDIDNCSDIRGGATSMSIPITIVDHQPRVCSLTLASEGVYFTTCETPGSVLFAAP